MELVSVKKIFSSIRSSSMVSEHLKKFLVISLHLRIKQFQTVHNSFFRQMQLLVSKDYHKVELDKLHYSADSMRLNMLENILDLIHIPLHSMFLRRKVYWYISEIIITAVILQMLIQKHFLIMLNPEEPV